jgi:hypothetical protein
MERIDIPWDSLDPAQLTMKRHHDQDERDY